MSLSGLSDVRPAVSAAQSESQRAAVRHPARRGTFLERAARTQLFRRLERLRNGRLHWRDGEDQWTFGEAAAGFGEASVQVLDPAFYLDLALGGSVAAGEAYMAGLWRADDLVGVLRLFLREREVLQGLEGGFARLSAPALALLHGVRMNTRAGSKRNIAAHYDLGNDFYRLFLDESLMYSCALYGSPEATLEEAQRTKLERICTKLDLRPGERLLEIGTGWGAMAIHAARHHGVHVTTTTISREQHALATERVREAGLSGRIEVLFEDYRDLDATKLGGCFDKLVSIEMVEAVGERFLDTYMGRCSELLAPQGLMLLQAITIQDQHYAAALKSVDFIQKHIFPGSFIPSVGAFAERAARVTDMKIVHLEDIGPHYARTLREWRTRFLSRLSDVQRLGFDARFQRLWEYYLSYCEAGFEERALGDVQILFAKPRHRGPAFVPSLA
jgi:cyclopropane-fatty-acyl-phospholipid synthase